ncbi:DUF5683 domain-containing protein [uncultured Bacteroides sp.]|uniref:DUF5683 domain-containing protein n=1 Tax=uncultured Bacteroides sp. TaxID=162156 RepID=UPI00259A9309|nr:DUF5683 domain-containing protein [uncultured Bacteroides sp.]
MKFSYIFLLLILLCSNSFNIVAKTASDKVKPRWLTSSLPENISPSYIFISASGSGTSLEEARQRTLVNLTTKLEHERGIKISSSVKVNSEAQRINGKRTQNTVQTFQMECTEDDKNITLTTRAIDEYWERSDYGNFICYILYTVSDTNYAGGSYDDDIKLTTSYGAKGFFMSLIPGVGQLYKGSKTKGAYIMGGEILLIGGIITTESLRSSYIKKMKEQPKFLKEYNTKADNFENARNICIGAAAALYVYNLIDAIVAPGARRVIVKRNRFPVIQPVASREMSGVSLSWNFNL